MQVKNFNMASSRRRKSVFELRRLFPYRNISKAENTQGSEQLLYWQHAQTISGEGK
jgi:hypothetical protein